MTEEIQPWPLVDPEAFEEMMRRLGAALTEAGRQLAALVHPGIEAFGRATQDLADTLDAQWPEWREFAANVPDYEPEPPFQSCNCLCAIAHGGLGACIGEAEPELYVTGRVDSHQINIPVCRECFNAKVLVTP